MLLIQKLIEDSLPGLVMHACFFLAFGSVKNGIKRTKTSKSAMGKKACSEL